MIFRYFLLSDICLRVSISTVACRVCEIVATISCGISLCASIRVLLLVLGYVTASVFFRARAQLARFLGIFRWNSGKYIFFNIVYSTLGATATWSFTLLLVGDFLHSPSLVPYCWYSLPAESPIWSVVLGIWCSVGQFQQVSSRIAQKVPASVQCRSECTVCRQTVVAVCV